MCSKYLLLGVVAVLFVAGCQVTEPVHLEAMKYCTSADECVPVGCTCGCSGCGGFSYEDIVNEEYVDEWYSLQGCEPVDTCPEVCCMAATIACENNVCVVKSGVDTPPEEVLEEKVILDPKSPLGPNGNGGLLSEDDCLTAGDVETDEWGMYLASKDFLLQKGLSSGYFEDHFCPMKIKYEYHEGIIRDYGYVRVTYKFTYDPYVAWWQHRFPIFIDDDDQPIFEDGVAVVDTTNESSIIPYFEIAEYESLLSPRELTRDMASLIGKFVEPIHVYMDRRIDNMNVIMYGTTQTDNPDATSTCGDSIMIGIVDMASGDTRIKYSGECI
ncbi:MAG: hypothetical protein ABIE94_03360 [archaeon]